MPDVCTCRISRGGTFHLHTGIKDHHVCCLSLEEKNSLHRPLLLPRRFLHFFSQFTCLRLRYFDSCFFLFRIGRLSPLPAAFFLRLFLLFFASSGFRGAFLRKCRYSPLLTFFAVLTWVRPSLIFLAILGKLHEHFGISVGGSNFLDLDSSTPKKFSRHLIVHLPGDQVWSSSLGSSDRLR